MSGLAPGLPEGDDALDAQSGTQDAQDAQGVGPKTWGWDQHDGKLIHESPPWR